MAHNLTLLKKAGKQPGVPLSTVIKRIIWLCMLPLFLFATGMAIYEVGVIHRQQNEQAAFLAENFVLSIDKSLNSRIKALNVLAMSPLVDDFSRWNELYREARGFYQIFGTHVVISDGGTPAHLLLNTRVPFGTKLPVVEKPNGRLAGPIAIRTGQPAVSDLFAGPVAHKLLVGIAVPVLREGRPKFAILTTIDPEFFQKRIDQVVLPPGWSMVLKDAQGELIAGRLENPIKDPAARYVADSQVSHWTVAVEVPYTAHWRPLVLTAVALGAVLLAATLAGYLGGNWAGRRLGRSVASLTQTPAPGTPPPDILEVAAARRLLDEEAERRTILEARYRNLFRYSPDAIFVIQEDRVTLVNEACLQLFGAQAAEELIGKRPNALFHPDFQPAIGERIHRLLDPGESAPRLEAKIVRIDGGAIDVEVLAVLFPFEGSNAIHVILRDITKRKQAAEILAASERKYRELIETANSIIIRWDKQGVINFINEFGARFFGYKVEELIDRDVMTIVPKVEKSSGRDLDALVKDIVVNPDRYTYVPNENLTRDGRIVWVAWTNKAITDEQGSVQEILAIGNDITQLKEAQTAREESESLYRAIAQNFPEGAIYIFDHDLRFRVADGEAVATLGFSREELEGKTIWEATDEKTCAILAQRYPRVLAGESLHFETPFKGRVFSSSYVPIRDSHGKITAGMVVSHDITERKQAEEALRESKERIQASLAEKEVLLQEIHHRVKNNMQVISSLVALQAHEIKEPAMKNVLQETSHRVRSMAMVHEKLYQSADFARVDFADYARSLLAYLWRAYSTEASGVS